MSLNGVIRIGRKGKEKVAFGEEGTPGSEPFEIDVVAVYNQWLTIQEGFVELVDGKRLIPNIEGYNKDVWQFVKDLTKRPDCPEGTDISLAEALEFVARIMEKKESLANFFEPKLQEKSASQESYALRFSET